MNRCKLLNARNTLGLVLVLVFAGLSVGAKEALSAPYVPECLNVVGTNQTLKIDGLGHATAVADQVTYFATNAANERSVSIPEVLVTNTSEKRLGFFWSGAGPLTVAVPNGTVNLRQPELIQVGTVAVSIGLRLKRSPSTATVPAGPEGESERVQESLDIGEAMIASIRVAQRMGGSVDTGAFSGSYDAFMNVLSFSSQSIRPPTYFLGYLRACSAFAQNGWKSVNELRSLSLTSTSQLVRDESLRTAFISKPIAAAIAPSEWLQTADQLRGFSEIYEAFDLKSLSPWMAFAGARSQTWSTPGALAVSSRIALFSASDRLVCNDLIQTLSNLLNAPGAQISARAGVGLDARTSEATFAIRCLDGEVRFASVSGSENTLLAGQLVSDSVPASPPTVSRSPTTVAVKKIAVKKAKPRTSKKR